MTKILDMLAKCPLFEQMSTLDREAIVRCLDAQPQRFSRGETILAEGEACKKLGIVISGCVQVLREDVDGSRSMMGKIGPGDLFAEVFALSGVETMPVSVAAVEPSEVMLIDAQRIMYPCSNACGFHQQMIYNLMRILARKNLAFNQKIEITSRRTTRGKLMRYLMIQAKEASSRSFTIPYDRQELADYLEVDRSGLSAEIGKLRREGVLTCEKNRFTLLGQEKI